MKRKTGVRKALIKKGIDMTTKPYGYWTQNTQLLTTQSQTMSSADMAKAHQVTERKLRNQLSKMGIQAPPHPRLHAPDERTAHLQKLADTHTATQIAQLEGKTIRAIYQELGRRGIKAVKTKSDVWAERSKHMAKDAQTCTAQQLASKYGLDLHYLYKMLARFGITPQPGKPGRPAGYGTQRSNPVRTAMPASKTLAAVPQRTSIAQRAPAQIIWPAHIKVQRIALPALPANAPICPSTMRGSYRTGQGLTGYQSY